MADSVRAASADRGRRRKVALLSAHHQTNKDVPADGWSTTSVSVTQPGPFRSSEPRRVGVFAEEVDLLVGLHGRDTFTYPLEDNTVSLQFCRTLKM